MDRRRSEGSVKQAAHRKARQIHEITRSGHVSDLTSALKADDVDVNYRYGGQTASHIAVQLNSMEKCQLLLSHGADLNAVNCDGNSPLNLACQMNSTKLAAILLRSGADVNLSNNAGSSPLITACLVEARQLLEVILKFSPDVDQADNLGRTAFRICIERGRLDLAALVLTAGCDVDRADGRLRTALMVAVEGGKRDIVEMVTLTGADIDHQDKQGHSALFEAAGRGQIDMVRQLVQAGASLNLACQNSRTALFESVDKGKEDVLEYLISSGCDVNLWAYNKQTPLHIAVKQAISCEDNDVVPVRMARVLLNAGCDVNLCDQEGCTALYLAAQGGHLTLCQAIVARNPILDFTTNTGNSLLHAAVLSGKCCVTDFLGRLGAPTYTTNKINETPLYLAVVRNVDIKIIEILLKHGCDIDEVEFSKHQTALMAAVKTRYTQAVKLLCDKGCDVNIPDKDGCSPLNKACELKDDQLVKLLLMTSRCDVDGGRNNRPLLTAVKAESKAIVSSLIEAGCNLNVMDLNGMSALYLAAESNSASMVRLLLKNGCDPDIARTSGPLLCCQIYTDPHPHLELSPLYIAVKNDAISMLTSLLQCYSPIPYFDIRYLYDIVFTTSYAAEAQLSDHIQNMLREIFIRVLFKPPSLLLLCRNAVRKNLGSRPHSKVDDLPIPKSLKSLVLMTDVFK